MKKKTVGNWEIEVSDPHPCWVSINYDQCLIARGLRKEELLDLQYALDRALEFIKEME